MHTNTQCSGTTGAVACHQHVLGAAVSVGCWVQRWLGLAPLQGHLGNCAQCGVLHQENTGGEPCLALVTHACLKCNVQSVMEGCQGHCKSTACHSTVPGVLCGPAAAVVEAEDACAARERERWREDLQLVVAGSVGSARQGVAVWHCIREHHFASTSQTAQQPACCYSKPRLCKNLMQQRDTHAFPAPCASSCVLTPSSLRAGLHGDYGHCC